jgi:hypothetical protein
MRIGTAFAVLVPLATCTAISSSTLLESDSAASCKTVLGDTTWPAKSVWRKAMPEIESWKAKGAWKQPTYRLDATTVDEVIAAVNFTKEHNIRLSIITSGHDFVGRNDAPNGLSLSVSGLKGARVSSSFTATNNGVPSVDSKTKPNVLPPQSQQAYVTFGAGYNTRELNNLLAPSRLFTLGAAHASVSVAGGWGQTGGHAPFSSRYGLGVDQVVEYKVVTADGILRIANAVSNPDLFWALRGGGGGTFGVVVEATIKAHASTKVSTMQLFINTTNFDDHKSIYPMAAEFHTQFSQWNDKGLGAYYWLYPNALSAYIMYPGADASKEWMNTNILPLIQKLSRMPGISNGTMINVVSEYPDFWSFFKATWGDMPENMAAPAMAGMDMPKTIPNGPSSASLYKRHGPGEGAAVEPRGILYLDSWLLGKKQLTDPTFAAQLEAVMPKQPGSSLGGQFIGGGQVLALGKNDTTSILPAWRKTYLHLILYAEGKPDALALRKFAPEMGAYVNEASAANVPNWRTSFWGDNYPRLSALKKKYDPTAHFWVTPGINAEAWTVSTDGRLCPNANSLNTTSLHAPPSDNHNEGKYQLLDEIASTPFPIQRRPDGSIVLTASLTPPKPAVSAVPATQA